MSMCLLTRWSIRLWNEVSAREQGSWATALTTREMVFYLVYGLMYTRQVS
ncbi:hypothetical protein Syun_012047 [Stephania yunnanensis]|uniref:Uncharacterized protein n=1 Tax=Stephania yunnanensis TaxID=152371 RepID=A0AAP0JYS7_9MAGN